MAQQREPREALREEAGKAASEAADRAQRSVERLENAFNAFWREAAGGDDGAQPFVRQAAEANMEIIQLLGRRTRAAAELPSRLISCRSPQEAWAEQLTFMRDMYADYQNAAGRLFDVATEAVITQSRQMQLPSQSGNGHDRQRHRD